jgi:DNA-binding response OmpR family regulator
VEDNRDSREMLVAMLTSSKKDYSVVAVETAAEALARIGKEAFDLYILDLWLPTMDGMTLCRRIRERGVTEPIMFLSAMVQPNDRKYVLAAGADAYLVKPDDLGILLETVERLLSESNDREPFNSGESRSGDGLRT